MLSRSKEWRTQLWADNNRVTGNQTQNFKEISIGFWKTHQTFIPGTRASIKLGRAINV